MLGLLDLHLVVFSYYSYVCLFVIEHKPRARALLSNFLNVWPTYNIKGAALIYLFLEEKDIFLLKSIGLIQNMGLIHSIMKNAVYVLHRRKERKLQLMFMSISVLKRNTCKELELPLLSSQLYISCILMVEKRERYSVRRNKGLVLLVVLPDSLQYERGYYSEVFNIWYVILPTLKNVLLLCKSNSSQYIQYFSFTYIIYM